MRVLLLDELGDPEAAMDLALDSAPLRLDVTRHPVDRYMPVGRYERVGPNPWGAVEYRMVERGSP